MRWFVFGMLASLTMEMFVWSLRPRWRARARWGRRGEGPPLSASGMRLIGTVAGFFAITVGMGDRHPMISHVAFAGAVLALIAAAGVYVRDRRVSQQGRSPGSGNS